MRVDGLEARRLFNLEVTFHKTSYLEVWGSFQMKLYKYRGFPPQKKYMHFKKRKNYEL